MIPAPWQLDRPEPRGPVRHSSTPSLQIPTMRGALEVVGLVIAPATLVTALAFYFGWVLTNSRASYFGLDASALGYSIQDYLLRSADALFVPLGAACIVALGIVLLHTHVMRQLTDPGPRARLRLAARTAAVIGGVLFTLGTVAVFEPLSFSPYYLFPPASPGIGITLLAYTAYLLGRLNAIERPHSAPPADPRRHAIMFGLVCLLIVLSSFWTASTYAQALGRGRAAQAAATLSTRPHVAVFAPRRLFIEADGVVEHRLTGDNSAYRYRYSGLRLLMRSGGKYFLLPDSWARATGIAIVLGDSPDYRFEFTAGR
jgi:hypothetical protein